MILWVIFNWLKKLFIKPINYHGYNHISKLHIERLITKLYIIICTK